jgi:hypothetical protein
MWAPRRLTTHCAFTACYRDSFTPPPAKLELCSNHFENFKNVKRLCCVFFYYLLMFFDVVHCGGWCVWTGSPAPTLNCRHSGRAHDMGALCPCSFSYLKCFSFLLITNTSYFFKYVSLAICLVYHQKLSSLLHICS